MTTHILSRHGNFSRARYGDNTQYISGTIPQCFQCNNKRVTREAKRWEGGDRPLPIPYNLYPNSYRSKGKLAGYARLSLPLEDIDPGIEEIRDAALIREVHVYGPALAIGDTADGRAQHRGLGTRLLHEAKWIAAERGYERMAATRCLLVA